MYEAYPLQWPFGKPRSKSQERARFDISQERAQRGILHQIILLGGTKPVISTNIELRRDGLPYANRHVLADKGVAVYFTLRGNPMCFACDRWDDIGDNMQAIHKTIEALRGIERWGSGDMVQQAFTGFTALPSQKTKRPWWEVLEVAPVVHELDTIKKQFYRLAHERHPDRQGGSNEAMAELNEAYNEFKRLNNLD